MLMNDAKIAFIIPALNEEMNLHNTLTTIQRLFGHCKHVIISDNGSTDNTIAVANRFGARTTVHPGVSIAQLRNEGVKLTDAEILVFIDSDIQLDDSWPIEFTKTLASLQQNPLLLTGSRCRAVNKNNYVGQYWYNRLNHKQSINYINSGHLIAHRKLFELIGGFAGSLRTGEDYDFCQRAIIAGATLMANPQLIAWHDGYPDTIQGFMAREMWHGRDEFTSVATVMKSKVAIVAICTTFVFIGSIIASVMCGCALPLFGYIALWSILLMLLTVQKFGASPIKSLPHSAALYYLYLISRSLAWCFKSKRPKARS